MGQVHLPKDRKKQLASDTQPYHPALSLPLFPFHNQTTSIPIAAPLPVS